MRSLIIRFLFLLLLSSCSYSTTITSSSWCLVELAKIMERHNRYDIYVLPVFYHVAPSLVRGLKGKFGTAFLEHEVRFSDKVQEWREAFKCNWQIKRGEVQFIKEIVEDILKKIPRDSLEKDKIFGINSDINKLVSILDIESTQEVHTLGIWGMGGVGKTTIARALFKRVRYKFEGSSFVSEVRTKSKKNICSLQKQILKDTKTHPKEVEVPDKETGAEFIQKRLCVMKVLLVLDDVDNLDQLEFLAAEKEWFGAGSRIILTTRDEQVLTLANTNDKFKHTPLSTNEALNLFCIHAFQQSSPPNETLKIRFDGLKDSEKEIFLDIACFFEGYSKKQVIRVLDGLHKSSLKIGIRVLIQKSLITVSNKWIDMHDLVQDMGEQIALETNRKRRLSYRRYEEICNLIRDKKTEREKIEAIVDLSIHEEMYHRSEDQDEPDQAQSNEAKSDGIQSNDQDESSFDDLSDAYQMWSDDQDQPNKIPCNDAGSNGIMSDDQNEPDEIQSNKAETDEERCNSKYGFNGDVFENMKELLVNLHFCPISYDGISGMIIHFLLCR